MRSTGTLCLLVLMAAAVSAFGFSPFVSHSRVLHTNRGSTQVPLCQATATEATDGVHGEGFRFLPFDTLRKGQHTPFLLPIAGMYPDVTRDQLMAPAPMAKPPQGGWNFHFINADAAPMGFVSLTGNDILDAAVSPVVLIATDTVLNLDLGANGVEKEVLVVVDRGDAAVTDPSAMDGRKFYVLANPQGQLQIRWMEQVPAGMQIMGRVVIVCTPYVAAASVSGWAEMDDEFEY